MLCRITDLRYKEVVNVNDGSCMGCVSDVEIDTCCAGVTAIVIYGRQKHLKKIHVGEIWRPDAKKSGAAGTTGSGQ